MFRLSLAANRVIVSVALVQMLFFLWNFYRLHLFAPYDKKAFVVSSVLLGICVLYVGPTVEEMRRSKLG